MKIDNNVTQNVEKKDFQPQLKDEDIELLQATNLQFSEMLSQKLNGDNLNNFVSLNADYNYDTLSMNIDDASFFINLAQNIPINMINNQNSDFNSIVKTDIIQNEISTKPVEISNKLTELIDKAQSTQKPVRISFDNDVSVILKIDKHGKITAEFIPGNVEVENYLRNNIASLRQKFDEQNLPYNDLLYRQNGKQQRNKNKEKGE